MTVTVVDCEKYRGLKRDAERYRFLRDEENWGDDGGEDSWAALGEATGGEFDTVVDSRMEKAKQEGGEV